MNFEIPQKEFQNQVFKKFINFKWDKPVLENGCISKDKTVKKFELNKTQEFVKKYFTQNNPNGLFLWHSVGSGKTLSSIAILKEFEKKGYNTLWVTRTTLKGDLQKALDILPLDKKLMVISYKQFSNIWKKKGELYKYFISRSKKLKSNTEDPLYKTVVIIDEVHKLYTKDLKPQEMHDIKLIENMIYNSYEKSGINSCKVVLMSATPITSDPLEIIKLLNLIIEQNENRFDISTFKQEYIGDDGNFTEEGGIAFRDRVKDLVSYIDMSKDPRKFSQIKYSEVLVPISSPEFDTNFSESSKDVCNKRYNFCKEKLNLEEKECIKNKEKCKKEIIKNKKIYKDAKYQTKIIKEKCNIEL